MSMQETAESIARLMATGTNNLSVQVAQTQFRLQLVEQWHIPPGAKILEIGCGQGDMTAVLAHTVGDAGHVMAVDSAPPEYGSPVSIGEAAAHLKQGPLGSRMKFCFQYDLLNSSLDFSSNAFDFVVLAHCSWYFASPQSLRMLLKYMCLWANRLCFSEWDMVPQTLDQVAHLLAVLIQGQVETYKMASESNIRTPLSRARLKQILQETGWRIETEAILDSSSLQDAGWEIAHCLRTSLLEASGLNLSAKMLDVLSSEVDILREMAERGPKRSLDSYAILAQRQPDIASTTLDNSGELSLQV